MKIWSKLIFFSLICGASSLLAQVSISPSVSEIDMTNGLSVSLNISNTSGTSQPISLSVGSGFSIQLNRCPSTLANNKVCAIRVAVSPASLSSGTTIIPLMNGASSLVDLKYVKSTIAQVSSISVSPPSLSFGTLTRIGNSVPQSITITNTGNITLSPIIELSSKMSVVMNRCSSLQAGKSCTISVSASPTSDMSNGAISGQSITIKKDSGDTGSIISASASLNITLACSGLEHQENGLCVSNNRSCLISNGSGTQSWSGTAWSACSVVSCNSGFMTSGNSCVASVQSCPITNGTGSQTWSGSSWGQCNIVSCNSGYENNSYGCINRTVTTIAGNGSSGSSNGQGTLATFSNLRDITKDSLGNLYVADIFNNSVRKISPTGLVTSISGFNQPHGIVASSTDIIYVAESGSNVISKITGGVRTVLAGSGAQGDVLGTGTGAQFKFPTSLTIDSSNNVYVFDSGNYKIKKITPAGVVSTFVGNGFPNNINGTGTSASLPAFVSALTMDVSGNMYLATGSVIKKITSAGTVSDLLSLSVSITGLTIDKNNIFYATGSNSNAIYKIDSLGNTTSLLGTFTSTVVDGIGLSATTFEPNSIMIDNSGTLYFTEYRGRRVRQIQ